MKADGEGDSGKRFTISGHIKDAETGEDLIGATVYVKELKTGTTSNVYGFYALSLVPGNYTIQYSYIGFDTKEISIQLEQRYYPKCGDECNQPGT